MKPTERQQFTQIREQFFTGRAIFLLGPRDGGKQAFLNALLQEVSQRAELSADNVLMLNGEDPDQRSRARSLSAKKLLEQRPLLKVLCFLEVQRFPEIDTLTREILAAHPDLQLVFLSSSRNDTVVRLQEACAGRRATFHVLPPAMAEHPSDLHQSMVHGRYPSALEDPASASLHLQQILRQTIQKEVLHSGEIRKPDVLDDLLVLLARNLGNELIIRDLSLALDLDPKTILRYIGLLEKAFLVFRVPSYFGFLENEITASRKLYFYDNGIRNAILGAYQPVAVRPDAPALWENFLVSERLKQLNVQRERVGVHYWRSTQRQEVSYLEKREEGISAWQFNWEGKKPVRFPKTFTKNYGPVAQAEVRPDNYEDFLGIVPMERVAVPAGEAMTTSMFRNVLADLRKKPGK